MVNAGDIVAVQCMVLKGDLPINIFWMHNNDVNIIKTSSRISTLNIESVNANHRGTFHCIASNLAGRSDQAAELNVNGKVLQKNKQTLVFFFPFPFLTITCSAAVNSTIQATVPQSLYYIHKQKSI